MFVFCRELRDPTYLLQNLASFNTDDNCFYTSPFGQLKTDDVTMMQIFIAVFGLDEGEFFYLQVRKLATLVSKLPQYTLHLFSQCLTLHYRDLVKTELKDVFELEARYLKEYLNVLIEKLGVKQLYDKVLFYVESYTKLETGNRQEKKIQDLKFEDKMEVSNIMKKVSAGIY